MIRIFGAISESYVNFIGIRSRRRVRPWGLASSRLASDMVPVSDDADLDRLVARIHADLRAGRKPGRRAFSKRKLSLRAAFAVVRGAQSSRWLAPVLIVAVVTILVLLFGAH
jgi:hypothetical protein